MREWGAGAFAILCLVPCGHRPGKEKSGSCTAPAVFTGATAGVRSNIFIIRSVGSREQSVRWRSGLARRGFPGWAGCAGCLVDVTLYLFLQVRCAIDQVRLAGMRRDPVGSS